MATQGRNNVHGKAGVRFKSPYTTSKRKSELRNLVTELIVGGRVSVTSGMAQDLKSLAVRQTRRFASSSAGRRGRPSHRH